MFGLLKKTVPVAARKPVPSEIDGVRVKPSARARRMSLRLDVKLGDVVLVWPKRASEAGARRFIEKNKEWIAQSRRKATPPQVFAEGGVISVQGQDFVIVRRDGRGVARLEGDALIVHGKPEYLHRRVKDFLKAQARAVLEESAARKQEQLGLVPKTIRVIDPRTRWGSCAPDGRLMFSWRLILAPPPVLDYLVAHEVAHRVHMNHGRRFWALCDSLAENAGAARRWLKKNGVALMSYK